MTRLILALLAWGLAILTACLYTMLVPDEWGQRP